LPWLAPLAGPLAVRGLRATSDNSVPVVAALAGTAPEPRVGWLALCRDEAAAIAALDGGADDATPADADPGLIAARLARIVRAGRVTVGELAIDPLARTASRAGRTLTLLPREYAVLLALARRADEVVSRAALNAAVWARGFDPGTNVIEVHVSRLRAELDRDAWPMLHTERGRGYRLTSAPVAEARIAS
jgi:two-component system, OmpR family, response regulator